MINVYGYLIKNDTKLLMKKGDSLLLLKLDLDYVFIYQFTFIRANIYQSLRNWRRNKAWISLIVAVFGFLLLISVRTVVDSSDLRYSLMCLKNLRFEFSHLSYSYCLSLLDLSWHLQLYPRAQCKVPWLQIFLRLS